MQTGPKSWDEGWTRLSGHIGGVWAFRTTSRKRFPAAYTQPLSLVLCKAAANCGAPQIVQHFVGFKYMISLYLLLKNNLMASELLSNFWTEFRLMNFSLLRNLKITQQLDSSFLKKTCSVGQGWSASSGHGSELQGISIRCCPGCICLVGKCLQPGACTSALVPQKSIYPNGMTSTAILFFHCKGPSKTHRH